MTKRFKVIDDMISPQFDKIETYTLSALVDTETKNFYFIVDDTANVQSFCDRLNNLNKENEQLKSEINMLKITIGRNEGYINRLTSKGEWNIR